MNKDDFRYMHQRKHIADLKEEELKLLLPIVDYGEKKDKALLILHGFSSSPAVYRYLIPKIKGYDALVCPVLPGHAKSIEDFSKAEASDWLARASEICRELVLNYKQVDVLGVSLGGLLALHLSQTFSLHHLFLLAPAIKLHANVKRLIQLTRVLKYLGFQDFRNMAGNLVTEKHNEIAYRKLPLSVILEILRFIHNYQWIPPPCPVDLFLGAKDEVVASNLVEQVFKIPNVSIHPLNRSAHVLPLDTDLDQIINCINTERP